MGCTAATVLVAVHFVATHPVTVLTQLQASTWWYAAAMALVSTVLPSWLISLAIARIGASQTATIGNLGPVLTLVLAWLVLGEAFTWLQLAGLLLVLAGIQMLDKSKTGAMKSA
jgi:drug/metabolite transporter (DMT)-like permease